MGLGSATFFDKETFGADKFVRRPGRGAKGDAAREAMAAYLAQAPLSAAVRRDVLAIETGDTDYMPGLTSDQKKDKRSEETTSELKSLMRISYAVFCLKKKTNQHYNKRNTIYSQRT